MVKRRRRSDAFVNGVPVEAPSANSGNPLLELPEALIADIASRAVRLGAGGALSLTCIAFSRTNLLNAPALRIQLDCQRCDQLLTPRAVAALQFRTCELALIVEEQRDQHNRQYIRLLTKLSIQLQEGKFRSFHDFTEELQPLAQLQVLTISNDLWYLMGLPELLQALPQLHTLQLPGAAVKGQERLDTLLAATQLTSIQLVYQ
ncbi:hypothetical protein HaLaN_30466 [Haematococcus lacustris]|uniref:Uncharacterized protein n=1 Tax=Haematococcus lacustris TaxID=44745 RepID=A0A6A0AGK5_HAELA|nr:hypothetical protein HaLaN_30466 [Haematococcus lacustris]